MLVLSRRANEQIVLPELGIVIEVVSVKGKAVRIGIDAPRDIRVLRGEVVGKPRPESAQRQPVSKSTSKSASAIVKTTGLQSRVSKMKESKLAASQSINYQSNSAKGAVPVRETASSYSMLRTPVDLVFDQSDETVAC